MERCPHCQELKNMRMTVSFRSEKDSENNQQKIEIKAFHCETCNAFVKSVEEVIPEARFFEKL